MEILTLLRSLGFHVHPTDGLHTGTRAEFFLGVLFETHRRWVLLPASFRDTLVSVARMLLTTAFRAGHRVRHHAMIRLTGTAVTRSLVVPSTHLFLRRICDSKGFVDRAGPLDSPCLLGGSRPSVRSRGYARLSHGSVEDVRWLVGLGTEPVVALAL